MEAYFIFLVKASLSMMLFYVVYRAFLRNETFFNINRLYLTGTLILSVFLPLFPLKYRVWITNIEPAQFDTTTGPFEQIMPVDNVSVVHTPAAPGLHQILMIIYLAGAAIIFIRLFSQTLLLISELPKRVIATPHNARIIKTRRYDMPFSFFGYIFYNPEIHTGEDLADIIAHEKVHIRERHWADLLITELLTVVFWFNPVIWWYERSIKQNHEYLADRGVLAQGRNIGKYQTLLINLLMGVNVVGITNHLNYSLNTTRLKMMTKIENSKMRKTRLLWAAPVVALLLMAFAKPVYQHVPSEVQEITESTISTHHQDDAINIEGRLVKTNGEPLHGASVVLGGTTTGTISDNNGRFRLQVPRDKDYTLYASFVGHKTAAIPVGRNNDPTKSNINGFEVVMEEAVFHINPEVHFLMPPPPPPPPPLVRTTGNAPDNGFEEVFIIVEEMPRYPGGFYELGKLIRDKQSQYASEKGIKGSVVLGFTVDPKGQVINVSVMEPDNEKVANAAIEIAGQMDTWFPGKQRGQPVPVNYSVPLVF